MKDKVVDEPLRSKGRVTHRMRVLKGYQVGKTFPICQERVMVGRRHYDPDHEIPIDSVLVGRSTYITQSPTCVGHILQRQGITNVAINGKQIEVGSERLLKDGDIIGLGDVELIYEPLTAQAEQGREENS